MQVGLGGAAARRRSCQLSTGTAEPGFRLCPWVPPPPTSAHGTQTLERGRDRSLARLNLLHIRWSLAAVLAAREKIGVRRSELAPFAPHFEIRAETHSNSSDQLLRTPPSGPPSMLDRLGDGRPHARLRGMAVRVSECGMAPRWAGLLLAVLLAVGVPSSHGEVASLWLVPGVLLYSNLGSNELGRGGGRRR